VGVAARWGRSAVSCGVGVGAASGGGRADGGVWTAGAGGVVAGRAVWRPVPGVYRRDGRAGRERRGTGSASSWVMLGVVRSSDDSVLTGASHARRRARAGAARSKSVRVPLTPDEATVIGEAAARAGMSVGAWVGDTAVGRARAEAAGDEPDEVGGAGLWSGRELVAALVALRAEVAAVRARRSWRSIPLRLRPRSCPTSLGPALRVCRTRQLWSRCCAGSTR
jgi:hypothetical protein